MALQPILDFSAYEGKAFLNAYVCQMSSRHIGAAVRQSPVTGDKVNHIKTTLSISIAALAALTALARAEPAADVQLPPVVVEGATIEAKPIAKPKTKVQEVPVASEQADDTPAPKKIKKKAASSEPVKSKPVAAAPSAEEPSEAEINSAGTSAQVQDSNGIAIDKVGTSVSVVTSADIKNQQIRNAADALRSLPGVSVSSQGTPGTLSVVRIRGAESQHTLVVIDGVEVNASNGNGFFDLSNLTSEEIESIEVLRGPQSGLYGSGAIGGVVNIITKSGKGPFKITAFGEGGSFGTGSGGAQISGGTDRAHGALTVQTTHSNGFNISPLGSERDAHTLNSFAFHGGVVVFDNFKIEGALRYSHKDAARDGFDGSAAIGGLAVANDDGSTLSQDLWTGRLAATLDTFDGHWIHQWHVARADNVLKDRDATFLSFSNAEAAINNYGYTSTVRIDGYGAPMRHFLTGRIEGQDEFFQQPTFDSVERNRSRTSAIGEARGEYFDALYVTGTVRQDWNQVFDDQTTWHAAASLKVPGTVLRLHASTGTGVKYPSFSEQFGFFFGFIPNPDLKAETSFGWDSGAELTLLGGKAVVDVTYFDQNLENEIDTKFLPDFSSTAVNRVGESTRRGIEVSARYAVLPGLTVGGAYTYLRARDDAQLEEIRRAPHSGKVDVSYAFLDKRANVSLSAIYNGDMKDVAFDANSFDLHRVTLDDYWLLRLAGSYQVQPGVELYGRVENLLDEKYQEVFGFQTAGLAAYAGVRITYEAPAVLVAAEQR